MSAGVSLPLRRLTIFTRDYLMRQVEQLARALAAIARLRQETRFDEALDTLSDACADLLGHPPHMLEALDPPSAARLLARWPRIKIYAALLSAEADLLADRSGPGDPEAAARMRRRALMLLLEALARGGRGDPDLADSIRTLVAQVPIADLPTHARRRVQELARDV